MSFFAINVLCFAAFLAMYWGLGSLAFGGALSSAWRLGAGVGCSATIAALGFRLGLRITDIGGALLVASVSGVIRACLHSRRRPRFPGGTPILLATVTIALVLAPLALGGLQFALFQANIYDQFNYLSSAVVRLTESHRSISEATREDFLRNPLLSIASIMRDTRPAVVDLYATFESVAAGNLHRCSYGFIASGAIATFFATSEWVRLVAHCPLWRAQLIGAALVAGFWGQLYFDLNAWSWSLSTPAVATAFGLIVVLFANPRLTTDSSRSIDPYRDARVQAIGSCGGSLTYLYPEILVFFFPAVAVTIAVLQYHHSEGRSIVRQVLWAAIIAFVISLPNLRISFELVFAQLLATTTNDHSALDWYWQAITAGDTRGHPSAVAAMYWLVGALGLSWLPKGISTSALALIAVAFLAQNLVRQWRVSAPVRCATLIAAFLAMQVIVLIALGHRWAGAKGLSYAVVVCLPLVLIPAANEKFSPITAPACLLLGLQLAFGVFRVISVAASSSGIHNGVAQYPAVTDPVLKSVRNWSAGDLVQELRPVSSMKVDVPDLWLESYATICAQSLGSRFSKELPAYTYWGFGDQNYGKQVPLRDYDALAYLEYDASNGHAALAFARRDGKIVSPRNTPILHIRSAASLDVSHGRVAWKSRVNSNSTTRTWLTIRARETGYHHLVFGILAPRSTSRRAEIRVSAGFEATYPVLGHGDEVIQVFQVEIFLAEGMNEIELALHSVSDESVEVTFLAPAVSERPDFGGNKAAN